MRIKSRLHCDMNYEVSRAGALYLQLLSILFDMKAYACEVVPDVLQHGKQWDHRVIFPREM